MALTSWKTFTFFDVSQVRLPDGDGSVALDQGSVSCVIPGTDRIFAGTPDGIIHTLDQSFKSARSWKAHDAGTVSHLHQIEDTSYLVSLSEDLVHEPELKVWALDQTERKSNNPKCLCTITVQNGRKNFPVSAFAVTSDLAQLAVGFANGAVTVVRGDLIHDRGTKQRTVFESEEPITGLQFREANTTALYIATTTRISALSISGKGQGSPARTLDEHGCAVGCMTLDLQSNDIIVARDDAIYVYGPRGKTFSYAYEGSKKLVSVSGNYVLVVSPPNNTAGMGRSMMSFLGGTRANDILNSSSFTILDTDLKFVAYSNSLSNQVSNVFSIWDDIFLLTVDGKLMRHHEKTFQQKLDELYGRDLYFLAINLARKHKVDPVQQNVIFRKYGDYLYQKGDYDTAMQQYLRAIDNTEPSQIIRKFLDNQRIKNLIDYLEELHDHHKATSDHTTLLLNCYAKLKDVDKLEEFIRQPGDLKFDLDTAIIMCRQGGYYDQAAFLARRHNEHGLVVDILIEDLKKYAEAVAYIQRLEPVEAYSNFMKYGTVLLEHCPDETTQLFIEYFTGSFRPKQDTVIVQETPTNEQGETGRFGTMATSATSAVQNLAALIPLPYMSTSTAPTPSTTEGTNDNNQSNTPSTRSQAAVVESQTEDAYIPYTAPKPRTAFPAFIDHPHSFLTFLQTLTTHPSTPPTDKSDLTTTLFELYLHLSRLPSTPPNQKAAYESAAQNLLTSTDGTTSIPPSNILLLSTLSSFPAGTTHVLESQNAHTDIFRSYTAAHDTAGALSCLEKYGDQTPSLYPLALTYLTSSPANLTAAGGPEKAAEILSHIRRENLMAPLQVVQLLSQNATATMALLKPYLSSILSEERQSISSNRGQTSTYRSQTASTLQNLSAIQTQPTSFSATRCASCSAPLDLPTVHFLCKHSFHQRCLNVRMGEELGPGVECPLCEKGNDVVRAVRRAQEESAGRGELFRDALERGAADGGGGGGWGVLGEWFGRGVMGIKTGT